MSDGDGTAPNHRRSRMRMLVTRLLEAAPKMEGAAPDDPGAFEAQIILRSGYTAVGALSIDAEHDMLKFMAMGKPRGSDQVIAAEHFFDYEDVEAIVVIRAQIAAADKPKIYTGQV